MQITFFFSMDTRSSSSSKKAEFPLFKEIDKNTHLNEIQSKLTVSNHDYITKTFSLVTIW